MPTDRYPALFEVSTGTTHSLGGQRLVTFGGADRADVGIEGLPGNDLLFQVERDEDSWSLLPWSVDTKLTVNHEPAGGRVLLRHLAIIQSGRHVFVFIGHEDAAVSTAFTTNQWLVDKLLAPELDEPAESPGTLIDLPVDTLPATGADGPADIQKTLTDFPVDRAIFDETITAPGQLTRKLQGLPETLELPGEIQLTDERMLIGRDPQRVAVHLPDLRVSRVHAWILRHGNTATIADLKSANGTFVDGQAVRQPRLVHEGSRIQIGPYSLVFTGTALFPLTHDKNVELVARNLVRRVPDRDNRGHMKVILEDVSLAIRPQEFVCILGPSGSGKSVLLSALSARHRADEGSVSLNGEDLYTHFDALKQNLAVVPQKDVLHDVLPLDAALWYTAKLRLPADMSRQDIRERIAEMLEAVRLTGHRATQIRRLSGGQGKRASWVNEAICNPSLIFLDEVTSGLDEQTDCEMMQLFREMADEGKTIVCVTHSVTYVESNCDLLVILAPGGVLAFVGPPAAALEFFEIDRLGDVYQQLSERSPQQWKQRFRESRYFNDYVTRRLPEPTSRAADGAHTAGRRSAGGVMAMWRQFRLLTWRYAAIQWSDKKPLAMMVGQSLLIAVFLVWLFGDISQLNVEAEADLLATQASFGQGWQAFEYSPQEDIDSIWREAELAKRGDYSSKLLFLLCISCLWFGCNNSAKEIVKERNVYQKERDVGLNVISYHGSKLALLGVLSVLQASLLYWCVRYFTALGGNAAEQWLLLSLTALAGVSMGLAISAFANTIDLAATIVPLTLIPQIIFGGLIAPLADYSRLFSRLYISAYWGYQGLLTQLEDPLPTRLRDSEYLDLGVSVSLTDVCAVLLAHVLVFSIIAVAALYARDAK